MTFQQSVSNNKCKFHQCFDYKMCSYPPISYTNTVACDGKTSNKMVRLVYFRKKSNKIFFE